MVQVVIKLKTKAMFPSKTHPCYDSKGTFCSCTNVPRQSLSNNLSDFIGHSSSPQRKIPKCNQVVLFTKRRQLYEDSHNNSKLISTLTPEQSPSNSGTTLKEDHSFDHTTLLRTRTFREENINECMTTANQYLYKRHHQMCFCNSGHKCRQKFKINHRNQLEAVNINSCSGESGCMYCVWVCLCPLLPTETILPELLIADHHKYDKAVNQAKPTKTVSGRHSRKRQIPLNSAALKNQTLEY